MYDFSDIWYNYSQGGVVMRRRFIWSVLCVLMLAIGIASAAGITEKEQLSGWVLDQAGEGVAGAQVLLLYSEDRFAAETDEAGYFHFQSVPKGLGVLVVRKAGYKLQQVEVEAGRQQEFKIILEPLPPEPGVLIGQILDAETGEGIWQVEVTAQPLRESVEFRAPRTFTGAKGYWRLSLPPGQYLITARHMKYQEHVEQVEVKSGEIISLAFKLVPKNLPPAFVHGRVESRGRLDACIGLPVPGARVVLTMDNQRSWETVTDDLGVFQFFGIPAGWGLLSVTKAGFKPWQEKVQLKAGETLELRVLLEPLPAREARIFGQVKDMKTGNPIAFARIQITGLEDYAEKARVVITDSRGYYNVVLPQGRYLLEAQHPEYFTKQELVDLKPGQQLQVNFLLRPAKQEPSVVVGVVYGAERRFSLIRDDSSIPTVPISGAEVTLSGEFGEYKTKTGQDGRFEFALVEPGRYMLLVRKEGYQTYQRMLTIPQGEKIELKISLLSKPITIH